MNLVKTLGLAAIAAISMTIAPSGASATTYETTGVKENQQVTITESLKPGTSVVVGTTSGTLQNTCTESHRHYNNISFTSPIKGPWPMDFRNCTRPITVHSGGELTIEHIASTTNGTAISSGAEITVGTPFGNVTCKTGAGTDMGTLTGVASGTATMDIKGVLNCGFILPSARIEGTWVITSPHGLGVVP